MQFRWPWMFMLSIASTSVASTAPSLELTECRLPDLERPARCGTLDVPENAAKPDGRRIAIDVVVVPASSGSALPDPIALLMGGPGEEATGAAAYYANQFAGLVKRRDLLVVDQRGTSKSAALRCDFTSSDDPAANLRHFLPPSAVKACEQKVREQADATQYTYTHYAHDLDLARRALGYERLNIFSASYGTRAASVYVREYPKSVRTVFMGSIVPLDVPTPLVFAKAAQEAFEITFDACAADSACRAAFPNLRDEFRQVLARLDAGVEVRLPETAGAHRLYRGRVVEALRTALYRAEGASRVPRMIHEAYKGNWTPIVDDIRASARGRAIDSDFSFGVFLTITCNDDVPFIRDEEIAAATDGTYLGDYRIREQRAACATWPKVTHAPGFRKLVQSSVPTMFVSGDIDPAAPLWYTQHAAPGFSNRVEILQRNQGHTEWNECVGRLYEQFVNNGSTRGLDTECEAAPRPPFKIE